MFAGWYRISPSRRRPHRSQVRPVSRHLWSWEPLESRLCLSAPEIAVLDLGAELVSGSTVPVDLGTVALGGAGPSRTFTVENDGDETLTLGGLILPPGFTLVEGLYSSISVRGSDSFTVRLNSSELGTKAGQVTIFNNDSDESPFQFNITGSVVQGGAEISVKYGNVVIVDGTTVPVDFGSATKGDVGPTRTFLVSNAGTQPLVTANLNLPVGFVLTESLSPSIAPLTSDSFSIRLGTSAAGTMAGDVSFTTNDADENPFSFPITGLVVANKFPEITVLSGQTVIPNGTAAAIDFGTAVQNGFGPTRTFVVRNDGTDTLTIGSVTVPTGFTVTEELNATLAPRTTDSFTVRLDSTTLGVPAGDVIITTNDPDENPFSFAVSGTVVIGTPEIRVVREDLAELENGGPLVSVFNPVTVGQSRTFWTFVVMNDGNTTLVVGGITLPTGFSLQENLSPKLAPSYADSFTVRLDNVTVGTKSGDLLIHTNDADENPFRIPLFGTVLGLAPEISVQSSLGPITGGTQTAMEFGDGVQRQPGPKQSFVVRNLGTDKLIISSISLPRGLVLLKGLPDPIAPRSSDSFTVQLDTELLGPVSGEISLVTNDADENPFTFPITANVTASPVPNIALHYGGLPLENGGSLVIDFGTAVRRHKGPSRTFTIRNEGSDALRIDRIEVPDGFVLVKRPSRLLSPRGTDTFVVRLDTKLAGAKAGRLRVFSNDADDGVFVVDLAGNVTA